MPCKYPISGLTSVFYDDLVHQFINVCVTCKFLCQLFNYIMSCACENAMLRSVSQCYVMKACCGFVDNEDTCFAR